MYVEIKTVIISMLRNNSSCSGKLLFLFFFVRGKVLGSHRRRVFFSCIFIFPSTYHSRFSFLFFQLKEKLFSPMLSLSLLFVDFVWLKTNEKLSFPVSPFFSSIPFDFDEQEPQWSCEFRWVVVGYWLTAPRARRKLPANSGHGMWDISLPTHSTKIARNIRAIHAHFVLVNARFVGAAKAYR